MSTESNAPDEIEPTEDEWYANPFACALRLWCPKCGSGPGSPCVTSIGDPRFTFHSARFRGELRPPRQFGHGER